MAICRRKLTHNITWWICVQYCDVGIKVDKNFLVGMKLVKCSLEAFQGFIRMAWILSEIKEIL